MARDRNRKAFFDTNVILYLVSDDAENSRRSQDLMTMGGVVSVQVLNEFTSVVRRKQSMPWDDVHRVLDGLRLACSIVPLTEDTHVRALRYAERNQLHICDANIIAAAALAGCATLYSEDMHDGLVIDGVTIRNPYTS